VYHLYLDMCRLLAFAFLEGSGPVFATVGQDAVLTALDSLELKVKILDLGATDMNQSLWHACMSKSYQSLYVETSAAVNAEERFYACMFRSRNHSDERVS